MHNKSDLPCQDCGGTSSLALYITPEPHTHCFKCGKQHWDLSEEEIHSLELNNLLPFNPDQKTNSNFIIERGVCTALEDRGITKETAARYKVETLFDQNNQPYARAFNHIDEAGNIFSQKIKYFDGRIKNVGDHQQVSLFGSGLFSGGGKYITITEGEEDAMAAYQMMKASNPGFEPVVVSIPDGAQSAEKSCKKAWEFINSFENIVIAFDGDEPGKKAAERISRLFNYKPKVILFSEAKKLPDGKWELKDANDYLKANKQKEFINLWWRSEKLTPKGVLSFKALWDSMTKSDSDQTALYPFDGLNKLTGGARTGELVIIKAPPKIGKTQLLREIAYHWRSTTKFNTGLIFLEDTKKSIGLGMCALHMNKPIQFGDIPINIEELSKAHEYLSEDDRLTVFDPEDSRTVENIMNKIMYFVKAHDCKFIILDHISMLAYQSGDGDERRFLDKLVADLKEMTTALNIGILAVVHVNDDGKTRGSRAPVQLCNILINLVRDKLNKDPIVANTTEIIVEENRKKGRSGTACFVYFDQDTGRLTELDRQLDAPKNNEFDT